MKDESIRISIQLIKDAEGAAKVNDMRLADQIESWAYIGKTCEENPYECYRNLRLKYNI